MAPRCCGAPGRRVFRRARWARVRGIWQRHAPPAAPTARAPRGSGRRARSSAGEVRAATTGRPCRPRRRRSRRRGASARAPRRSWMWISAVGPATRVAEDRGASRRAARSSAGRPGSDAAAASSVRRASRRRSRIGRRRSTAPIAAEAPRLIAALVSRATVGADASPWRWNGTPRSHSRSACQWISPIVRCVTSGWRSSIRSRFRSVSGDARRTRLVLSSGSPSCRSSIAIASRAASSRTWTV